MEGIGQYRRREEEERGHLIVCLLVPGCSCTIKKIMCGVIAHRGAGDVAGGRKE